VGTTRVRSTPAALPGRLAGIGATPAEVAGGAEPP